FVHLRTDSVCEHRNLVFRFCSSRKRFPVGGNIAFEMAGPVGGSPGSPTHLGSASLGTTQRRETLARWVSGRRVRAPRPSRHSAPAAPGNAVHHDKVLDRALPDAVASADRA